MVKLQNQSNPDVKIFLIGNKADLEDKRRITKDQGEKLCSDHKLAFFMETSAKTGFNVQNVFIQVAKELYKQHEEIKDRVTRPGTMISLPAEENNNKVDKLEIEEEDKIKRKKTCCF